jgi:exonuclease SbcC
MRVLQLDLENVKSYDHASVSFAPGTNAICGDNGAGKSTLLEAIGFVLFDFLATTQADFVREGEKTATVTLHVMGMDERAYQVVRKCGSTSQYYIYDPEIDQKLTDGKGETLTWLQEFLGVEETMDITALFRDAVGVPQGLLTSAFLDKPSNRKNTFNPLLRVDEYEQVWGALREPGRRLTERINAQENRIAGFEAETRALPELRSRAETLQTEVAAAAQRHTEAQIEMEDVAARRTAMEAVKTRLDEAERAVTQAEAEVQAVMARVDHARQATQQAEKAQAVVAETKTSYQVYMKAQDNLNTLEARRKERDRLRTQRQDVQRALAVAQERLETLEAELTAVTKAETEMEILRPQVDQQETLESALTEARRDADRLEAAQATLRRERARLDELRTKLMETQEGVAERAEITASQETLRETLETLDERRASLTQQVTAQRLERTQLETQLSQAAGRLTAAEQALEQAQEQLVDLKARLADVRQGVETLHEVEAHITELRTALETLDTSRNDLTAQVAAQRAALEQARAQKAVLEASESPDCPVCSRPLTPEHRAALLEQYQARTSELAQAIDTAKAQEKAVVEERQQKRTALEQREQQLKTLPRPGEIEDLATQIEEQQARVARSEQEVTAAHTEVTTHQTRRAEIETALTALQPQQEKIEATWQEKQEALRRLERRLAVLPRQAELDALVAQIARQESTVTEGKQAVEALTEAPAKVTQLMQELADLGDPRRAYRRASDTAARRATVTQRQQETQAEREALEAQESELVKALAVYEDLEARIEAERAVQTEHENAHQRYLQHIREAEALDERKHALKDVKAQLETAKATRDARRQARDAIAAEYDAEAYADLRAAHDRLRAEVATLAERLRQQRDQEAETRAEIARLEAVETDLEAARDERDALTTVQALLEHLRQVLREAGPEVTRALVEMISLHADQLYADIMQTYGGHSSAVRLRWTEDYDIVLSADGRERSFQQLSGGEQMAAALAVRLALLREISTVDIAFFDEPTAHLDRDRRANLARQILNVKGFSQLFVISHDDTFEQDTDHVVRITKENGASYVEE